MGELLYKVSYSLDNYGDKPYHTIRVSKFECFIKDKSIILENVRRRISRDKLDIIKKNDSNNTRGLKFEIMTLDESRIADYKIKLKESMLASISTYKEDIVKLESALNIEPALIIRDESDMYIH